MGEQLSFTFDLPRRPLGPWPVESDGITVRIPVRSRFVDGGIAWTLIDRRDYAIGMSRAWHVETGGHVVAHINAGRERIALHVLVCPPPIGLVVDHREGDKLDNRRESLRAVTQSVNSANLHLSRAGRSSKYRGVTLHRQTGKWQAAAKHMGRCHYAGLFHRQEDAARAYDRVAAQLWPGIVPPNIPITLENRTVNRTITFTLERETKGAVRYQEIDAEGKPLELSDSVVGSLYLRKTALDGKIPERVTVTIHSEAA